MGRVLCGDTPSGLLTVDVYPVSVLHPDTPGLAPILYKESEGRSEKEKEGRETQKKDWKEPVNPLSKIGNIVNVL